MKLTTNNDLFLQCDNDFLYLHQIGYASFFRNEDDNNVFITSCYHMKNDTKIKTFMSENNKLNRSLRRESSALYFWNENDSEIYSINFSQNKGLIIQEFLPVDIEEVIFIFGYETANEIYKNLNPNCLRCNFLKQPKRKMFCQMTGETIKKIDENIECKLFNLKQEG